MPTITFTAKKISACLLIFCSILILLGLPFKQWGFKTDDFSNIYATKTLCPQGIKKVFMTGNIECLYSPSVIFNEPIIPTQSFLSGLYRPMSFILYYPQYLLFGNKPYGYFLITIILHGLNSILFFLILCTLFSLSKSLFLALFFAFHPSLSNWLGWVSAQTYFSELFFFFLLIIFLNKFLQSKKFVWYLLSLLCFLITIFTKETTFVLPLWIFGTTYFLIPKKHSFNNSLKISSGFWVIFIFYCLARSHVMGINSTVATFSSQPTLQSYLQRLSGRFFDFVTYLTDLFGLTFLPNGHQCLKGGILLSLLFLIGYLWYHSNNKKIILWLFASILIFSWPIILIHYQPRYIYLILPMILTVFGLCFQEVNFSKKTSFLLFSTLFIMLFYNIWFIFTILKKREIVFGATYQAFHTLVTSSEFKQKRARQPILLAALPHHWFAMANAQAIWLLSNTTEQNFPIYQFGPAVNLSWQNCYLEKPFKKDCPITIQEVSEGFLFTSYDTKQITFDKQQSEILLTIPQEYLELKPLIFVWDYQHGTFKLLKNYDNNLV